MSAGPVGLATARFLRDAAFTVSATDLDAKKLEAARANNIGTVASLEALLEKSDVTLACTGKASSRADRRPRPGRDVTPHDKREAIGEKTAVHVTLSFTKKVPNLRSRKKYNLVSVERVEASLEGRLRQEKAEAEKQQGFRIVHFAVLGDHLHLLCEADSARWCPKACRRSP